ncbi:putative acetylesterase protein [Rhizobium phage RHph_Y25]|nr:putative acetylesterase protein [Rhizobium phage RHph_Y25]
MAAMLFGGAGLAYNRYTADGAYYIYPSDGVITGTSPYLDLSGRQEVALGTIDARTAVIVFIGQSLSVNSVKWAYTPVNTNIDQLNIWDGKLYKAKDPLLGINGGSNGGGTWLLRMADKLISDGLYDRVIIVPMAVGNTRVGQWSDPNLEPYLFKRINTVGLRMRDAGLPCTAIMWGQGESDTAANTSQSSYAASLQKVIGEFNRAIPGCPVLVAQEAYYYGNTNAGILAAQASVVNNSTVFAGENVELIGPSGRYDNTHLNDAGADQRATLAVAALKTALGL